MHTSGGGLLLRRVLGLPGPDDGVSFALSKQEQTLFKDLRRQDMK